MGFQRRTSSAVALAWALGTFLTLHAAFRVAFPEWIEATREPEYFVRSGRLLARLRTAPPTAPPPKVAVALGSSRTMYAVDGAAAEKRLTEAFDSEFRFANLGSAGGGSGRSLVYLGRLIREGAAPDVVFVEAHPLLLSAKGLHPPDVEAPGRLDLPDQRWLASFGLEPPPAPSGPMLWNRRAGVLTAWLPWATVGDRQDVWLRYLDDRGCRTDLDPAPTAEYRRAALEFAHFQYAKHAPHLELGGRQFEALRGVLAECRRLGARAAVVVTPEGPTFRSWYPPGVREAARERLKSLAAEYGAALVDLWDAYDDDVFVDSHHMLTSHAESFTLRMVDEAAAQWKDVSALPTAPTGPVATARSRAAAANYR